MKQVFFRSKRNCCEKVCEGIDVIFVYKTEVCCSVSILSNWKEMVSFVYIQSLITFLVKERMV